MFNWRKNKKENPEITEEQIHKQSDAAKLEMAKEELRKVELERKSNSINLIKQESFRSPTIFDERQQALYTLQEHIESLKKEINQIADSELPENIKNIKLEHEQELLDLKIHEFEHLSSNFKD
jgi:hypothetical protein